MTSSISDTFFRDWHLQMVAFYRRFPVFPLYRSVGSAIKVRHRELRYKYLWGIFGGPKAEMWVERRTDSLDITNQYEGRLENSNVITETVRRYSAANASYLLGQEIAAGITVSMEDDPATGAPAPATTRPGPGPQRKLNVDYIEGWGFVRVDGVQVEVGPVAAGKKPVGSSSSGLESASSDMPQKSTFPASYPAAVTCISKGARGDPSDRIRSIGGKGWRMTLDEAIASIEQGKTFYVERPAGDRVEVIVSVSRSGSKYLKTTADGDVPNNLLSLPECR